MPGKPDFTTAQASTLKRLSVTAEQIDELRKHLRFIAGVAKPMPTAKDIQSRLTDIAESARALAMALKRLERSDSMPNPPDHAANAAAWMLSEAHHDRKHREWMADPQNVEPTNPEPYALRTEIERLAEIAGDAVNHRLKDEKGQLFCRSNEGASLVG